MQGYGKCWRILAGTFPVKSCGTLFWVGVGGAMMLKCSEPIVVAHYGLSPKTMISDTRPTRHYNG